MVRSLVPLVSRLWMLFVVLAVGLAAGASGVFCLREVNRRGLDATVTGISRAGATFYWPLALVALLLFGWSGAMFWYARELLRPKP